MNRVLLALLVLFIVTFRLEAESIISFLFPKQLYSDQQVKTWEKIIPGLSISVQEVQEDYKGNIGSYFEYKFVLQDSTRLRIPSFLWNYQVNKQSGYSPKKYTAPCFFLTPYFNFDPVLYNDFSEQHQNVHCSPYPQYEEIPLKTSLEDKLLFSIHKFLKFEDIQNSTVVPLRELMGMGLKDFFDESLPHPSSYLNLTYRLPVPLLSQDSQIHIAALMKRGFIDPVLTTGPIQFAYIPTYEPHLDKFNPLDPVESLKSFQRERQKIALNRRILHKIWAENRRERRSYDDQLRRIGVSGDCSWGYGSPFPSTHDGDYYKEEFDRIESEIEASKEKLILAAAEHYREYESINTKFHQLIAELFNKVYLSDSYQDSLKKAFSGEPVEFEAVFIESDSLKKFIESIPDRATITQDGDISSFVPGQLQSQTFTYREESVKITHNYFAHDGNHSQQPIPFAIDSVQVIKESKEVVLAYKNHIEIVRIQGKIEALQGFVGDMNQVFQEVLPEEFARWHSTGEMENLREAYAPWVNQLPNDPLIPITLPEEERVSLVRQISSVGVDFIPILGNWKALQEACTGTDYITGETLSAGARAFAAIGVIAPQIRSFSKIVKTAQMSSKLVQGAMKACRKAGYQYHHIIPSKQLNSTALYEFLAEIGYDLESSANKIFLPRGSGLHPTRSLHRGAHVDTAIDTIRDGISKAKRSYEIKGDKAEALKKIENLVAEERALLRSGERVLNRAK